MRGVVVVAVIAAAGVCWGAAAQPGQDEPYPGLSLSENPSAAEQRAFVDTIFKNWDFKIRGRPESHCESLGEALKAGTDVTYLVPEAFGATEKPPAVTEVEQRCPYLYLGTVWENHGSDPTAGSLTFEEPVTAKDKTETYGEPLRATRNFALYRSRFPDSGAPLTVFMADEQCRNGECYSGAGDYSLIDEKKCLREDRGVLPRPKPGPAVLWSLVRIKDRMFFLEAGSPSIPPESGGNIKVGGPAIDLAPIPPDIRPAPTLGAYEPTLRDTNHCRFDSPVARRR